ncbi:hypothetical protein AURDEDRAFT_145550 [Auricularia subglabra TFB-10046 SS5]|nr:hypothetical protein AURDEDRAFT_145550 [Auricularia subglabra TFB-10046 SS5]
MCAHGPTVLALVTALALSMFWSAASALVVLLGLAHIVTPPAPPPRRRVPTAKSRAHAHDRDARHAQSRALNPDNGATQPQGRAAPVPADRPPTIFPAEAVPGALRSPQSSMSPLSPKSRRSAPHSPLPAISVEPAVPFSPRHSRSSSLVSSCSVPEITTNKARPRSWNPGERFSPPRPSPLRRILSLDGRVSAPTTAPGRPLSPVPSSRSTSPVSPSPSAPKIAPPMRRLTAPPINRRVPPKDRHTISAEIARAAWGDEWALS